MGNKRKLDEDLKSLTPAARKEYFRFKTRQKRLDQEIEEIALSILVWGPSLESNSPMAVKRREICEELRKQGHAAIYSEKLYQDHLKDIEKDENKAQKYLSLEFLEFNQARAAHLVILLVELKALGSFGELNRFGSDPALVTKLFAAVPKELEGSFSDKSVIWILDNGYGGVYWYKETDIDASNVFTKVILRVQARREMKNKEKVQRKLARTRGVV